MARHPVGRAGPVPARSGLLNHPGNAGNVCYDKLAIVLTRLSPNHPNPPPRRAPSSHCLPLCKQAKADRVPTSHQPNQGVAGVVRTISS
jgi:hypothetical protein